MGLDHDPMCPRSSMVPPYVGDRCECWLIDQVRADEQAARAEVAALRKQEWAEPYRREVLADLRAKVEGMRDEAKADPVGSAVWRTTAYESVLALIEEADNA